MIPYSRQQISDEDIEAVVRVLRSDFLTQGSVVPDFEKAVAERCGSSFGVAVNSATSALHIACIALELGEGDWLWTSPNTFVASANCGIYCGANVDFVDIDPRTYNMSVSSLTEKLENAKIQGNLPKIVVPVHFAGQPCDMKAIHRLGKIYGFKIIEDAAHALGAFYSDDHIGSCKYSDITVFSFHPVKIITSGEGGMAVTRDELLAEKMISLRSHGITRDSAKMQGRNQGDWYYEQKDIGFNFRMTDIQASLGLSQFERIDLNIDRRHEIARKYDEEIAGLPLTRPFQEDGNYSAYHLYPIQVSNKTDRGRIFSELRSSGINVNVHYIPVHIQPFFKQRGFNHGDFPNSEAYYDRAISLPMFSALNDEEQNEVIRLLKTILN